MEVIVYFVIIKTRKQNLKREVVNMLMWMDYYKAVLQSEKGQGMVEYGLILALIAVAVIGIMTTMGTSLGAMFNTISGKL